LNAAVCVFRLPAMMSPPGAAGSSLTGGPVSGVHYSREPGVHVRGCWVVDLVLGKV